MLLLILVAAAALLVGARSGAPPRAERDRNTAAALARAKEALLGYAVAYYSSHPGEFAFLPCPDVNGSGITQEGESHGSCGAKDANTIGRLPWKTLGLPPLRDSSGECLWYALSGPYKHVNAATKSDLLNEDSDGRFEILAADGVQKLAGATPGSRAVAVLFAPEAVLPSQARTRLPSTVDICGGNYTPANYLDQAGDLDNGSVSSQTDKVDRFGAGPKSDRFNDRLIFITRDELFRAVRKGNDLERKMGMLTAAVARCIARYGLANPGPGAGRLPWPAPVALADYRRDSAYDDHGAADPALSARVPDIVLDSSAATGSPVGSALSACTLAAWTPEVAKLWRNWKDHLFYAVARAYAPAPAAPGACAADNCLKVNGAGPYAALVIYSGSPLAGQTRSAPPLDPDAKADIRNYLEGRNAANHPDAAGNGDYQSGPATPAFNDILYCIDPALNVAPCP